MTTKIDLYSNYDWFIQAVDFNSHSQQDEIKQAVTRLPNIFFTHLKSEPLQIHQPELLQQAKDAISIVTDSLEEKVKSLEQAFILYKKFIKHNKDKTFQREIRNAATDAVCLGQDIIDILNDENSKESIRVAIKKIQIISGYSSALHTNSLNQVLDDALNIPQRHFAVTTERLGTTNVKDCIFLVLRNKDSHVTFAAHIDKSTNADSIKEAIQCHMTKGVFDSYIIGGHLSYGPEISDADFVNVSKVSRLMIELTKTGYTFDSRWWILQENTPINIVYDPSSDQFFQAVPGKELPSYASSEILIYLDEENKKLLPHFIDQQQIATICPVCLSPSVQKKLNSILDQEGNYSKIKILDAILEGLPASLRSYAHLKTLVKAYSTSLKEMISLLKKHSPHSSNDCIWSALRRVLESNQHHPFYILPFSEEKHIPLISEVLSVLNT